MGRPNDLVLLPDALLNHAALELCEYTSHLEHRLARWSAGVDILLVQIKVHPPGMGSRIIYPASIPLKCTNVLFQAGEITSKPLRTMAYL